MKLSREEIDRRERQDREEALGKMREHDIARGRLEGWAGGRVKPLIRENDE